MTASNRNTPPSSGSLYGETDFAKVDAQEVTAEEYDEIPELTDEKIARGVPGDGTDLLRCGRPLSEDAADRAAIAQFQQKLATGEEEMIPSEIVSRLLDGENRVRVWREYRGLSMAALAARAGIAQPFLSQIEMGKREGTVETLRKLAAALSLTIDDLVG